MAQTIAQLAIFSSRCQWSVTYQVAPARGIIPDGVRITGGLTMISPICTAAGC
ncbi:hypothetical protein TPA0907_05010 [Micromonospora humidisoli]|nr:hypothetical protein TPA0907_05010 [Micromonospora sp. AKA109]